ncbi:hypothetical protein [Saccharopolyspora montiporae]|uniref:hypothetical protein n=1 Tax=Saccharopolyspora montiporae TaxID=2781240 RepID=UPI001D154105|nr:hypothetical protein [Saccharopolyspora sp. HNM0983]
MTGLDHARAVADAVLYEGYLLYPYRASAAKNQVRWQFGVLGPADGDAEAPTAGTDCLLSADRDAVLGVQVRFLQLQTRSIERADAGGYQPVPALTCGDMTWLSWDEAVDREIDAGRCPVGRLLEGPVQLPVRAAGGDEVEPLEHGGAVVGRALRHREPLTAVLHLACSREAGGVLRLQVRLANTTRYGGAPQAGSLLSAHLVLTLGDGSFVSTVDPPESAREAAAACRSDRLWPVLVGDREQPRTLLAAPIILYDFPEVAEQSTGDLFDATEIDELLSLRVMTMTEDEKREARATDPRAAEIVDRCDELVPEQLARMHGTGGEIVDEVPTFAMPKPWWDPGTDAAVDPATDAVQVDGVRIAAGSSVVLRPGRRADAQDLFFAEQQATVTGVYQDVDGATHLAVVLDADPAGELHRWYGRYLYFGPEEVVPVPDGHP